MTNNYIEEKIKGAASLIAISRCRWAFISFVWPKETEPKPKKMPPDIIACHRKAYILQRG